MLVLGLILLSSVSSRAQREIGAESIALDDGAGHVVDITIPTMAGPGPYSWTLPITPGGISLLLPTPTTVGSMLYSNGTSWLENTLVLANSTGDLISNSLSVTSGNISAPNSTVHAVAGVNLTLAAGYGFEGSGGNVSISAGTGFLGVGGNTTISGGEGLSNGGSITVVAGSGGPAGDAGAQANLIGGAAGIGPGGNVVIAGGVGPQAGPSGGSILFQTTPNGDPVSTVMTIAPSGTVEIGSSNQFQVDQLGNATANSLLVTNGLIQSQSVTGAGFQAPNLLLIAGSNGNGFPGEATLTAGSGSTYGGDANITAGLGGTTGGNVNISAGPGLTSGGQANLSGGSGGNTGTGGNVVIAGGVGGPTGGPAGGSILFQTTPTNTPLLTRMTMTNAGLLEIGSSNQFQVDQLGNATANSLLVTNGLIQSQSVTGAGFQASNLLLIAGSNGNGFPGEATLTAGSGSTYGGDANITAGLGGTTGGNVNISAGPGLTSGGQANLSGGSGGNTGTGGNVVIAGGVGGPTGGPAGGSILFQTTPTNTPLLTRMTMTNAGLLEIGSSNQFQVDQSGNVSTSGHIATTSTMGFGGNDGTVVTIASVSGSDVAGFIHVNTSGTAGEGFVAVTFGTPYGSAPIVIVSPASPGAQGGGAILGYYTTATATGFQLFINSSAIPTIAQFNYMVIH